MEQKTIRELFREQAGEIGTTQKYTEQLEKIKLLRESLQNQLFTEKEKTTLNKLCEEYLKLSEIDSEQSFVYAFRLATRLISESFIEDKKNTSN